VIACVLIRLAALFGGLSLLAVGGGNGVIPEMRRAAVQVYHWLDDAAFLDLFALSRALPGPGTLLVLLVGQAAAGWAGAAVGGLAMFGPASALMLVISRIWTRGAAWTPHAERALAPVAVGLTIGSALSLLETMELRPLSFGLAAVTLLVLARGAHNPLPFLLGAAAISALVG
jgi:chromate transporter